VVESKSTLTEQFPDTVAKLQRLALVERIFDDMNNGFGWARLPKSFMAENTVFLLLTAMIRRSAMPLAIARTSTSSLWAGWTQKPSD
jgi:hypothetical protein